MLSSMRGNKKNQIFIYLLLGLLALGLIGFGTGSPNGARLSSIGTVGEEEIPVSSYVSNLNGSISRLSQQFGRQLNGTEIAALGIQRSALQTVVSTTALTNEATRLGLSVGDTQVADEIMNTPAFAGIDGQFDKESYDYALERNSLSPKEYEEQARKALSRQLVETSVASGTQLDSAQAIALLAYTREAHDFEWAKIDATILTEPVGAPTSEQITQQYNKTPDAYTAPAKRKLTYASITPEMLQDQVDVSDELIMESYTDQTSRFTRPARRIVDRVVFGSEEEATQARAKLDDKVLTFDNLALERGLTLADIDLGEIEKGAFPEEIDTVLFGTENLGTFGPIDTDLGPAIFRINAVMAAQETTFDEAKSDLKLELAGELSRKMIVEMVNDIDDLLAGGATIEDVALETDLELATIELAPDTAEGIAAYAEFRDAANALQIGDFPEILDLSDGGIFTARLDEVIEPKLKPLDDVKDQVVSDWVANETLTKIEESITGLIPALESGGSFSDLGITTTQASEIVRGGFVEGAPTNLTTVVMESETGKVTTVKQDGEFFVARLNNVTEFAKTTTDNVTLIEQVNAQISNQVASDLLTLFATAIETRDGVALNQSAINQLNTQIIGGTGGSGY